MCQQCGTGPDRIGGEGPLLAAHRFCVPRMFGAFEWKPLRPQAVRLLHGLDDVDDPLQADLVLVEGHDDAPTDLVDCRPVDAAQPLELTFQMPRDTHPSGRVDSPDLYVSPAVPRPGATLPP